ncbi:MAG TPA: glycosyltransferase family 4 protein, partial [Chloroflexia bacterium]|nr:glycosyltransferase family 4 protein [Chloroflexia bacterium]
SIIRTIAELARVAHRERVDLIHANSVVAGVHALPAAMLLGLPCIVHARDFNTASLTNKCVKLMLRYPRSLMVFVSEALARHYGAGKDCGYRYRVIYNAIDTDTFHPIPDARKLLLDEFALPEDSVLVGSVGRIEPWKGHSLLLDAFALVAEKHPQARLLIVGDVVFERHEKARRALVEKAHKHGISDKVVFTGFRKDMPAVMAGLDLLVHCPVEPEAFGLIIAEAMACGKPVVTVPLGGIPELVTGGKNGLLARPGDRHSLAAWISRLLKDPELRRTLGEEGLRTVRQRFGLSRETIEIQDLYDTMLALSPSRNGRARGTRSEEYPVGR